MEVEEEPQFLAAVAKVGILSVQKARMNLQL
jgi:hypothetical protein